MPSQAAGKHLERRQIPARLGAAQTRNQVHTTFKNLETMLCMDGHKPTITINAEDAAERGIATGDAVTAFNDRGEHYGVAYVTTH